MQKKRFLALVLALTMAVSTMLTGCGGNEQPSDAATENEAAETTETAESEELEEKTIQLWLLGPGKQKDSDAVWEAFNEKLQEYVPNTTVEISVFTDAEYNEKYQQMLASGEPVDLAWVANWVTGDMSVNTADGNFMQLDELLDEYGTGIKETLGDTILDLHRHTDGNLYYLVSWQGLFLGVQGFRVETELAKLAGETWIEDTQAIVSKWANEGRAVEDFEAMLDQFDMYLEACKEAGQLYAGVKVDSTFDNWDFNTGLFQYAPYCQDVGLLVDDNSFTVTDGIQTETYRVFAERMGEWYEKGYIRNDIASVDLSTIDIVKNGEHTPNTAILHCHNAFGESAAERETATSGVDMSVIYVQDQGVYAKGDATAMSIPYCSDDPERAMMVLDAIYTNADLYQLLIYGFEGTHYTDNGDGTIETAYGSQGVADSDYGLWKWTIGTCKNALTTQGDTPGYYEELEALEKEAYVNPLVNFVFDTTEVEDVVAALKAVDDEYSPMLVRGYVGSDWESTLDQWIAERKAVGVDKLIAEYQKQLDAYMEENNITSW